MTDRPPLYVTISEIDCPEGGVDVLIAAFRDRLGAVDSWPGFQGLEVLHDRRRPRRFLMLTRWRSKQDFIAYMKSPEHRASHARIPQRPARPRPAGLTEFDRIDA